MWEYRRVRVSNLGSWLSGRRIKHKSNALKHSNTKNVPINRNRVDGINMVPCPKLAYLNQFDPWLYVNSHTAIQDEKPVCGKRWKVLLENILDFLLKKFGILFPLLWIADANTWKSFLPFFSPGQTVIRYTSQMILFQIKYLHILTCWTNSSAPNI